MPVASRTAGRPIRWIDRWLPFIGTECMMAFIFIAMIHLHMSTWVFRVALAMACVSALLRLIANPRYFLRVDMLLLLGFLAIAGVSVLANREAIPIMNNFRPYSYMFIYIFCAYGMAASADAAKRKLMIQLFLSSFLLIIVTLCLFSLYSFFTGTRLEFPAEWNGYFIGLNEEGRMYTLSHPNTMGIYCYTSMIAAVLLACAGKRKRLRFLPLLVIPLLFACISITDSRASRVIFSVAAGAMLLLFLCRFPSARGMGKALRLALCVLLPCLLTLSVYLFQGYVLGVMNQGKQSYMARKGAAISVPLARAAAEAAQEPQIPASADAEQTPQPPVNGEGDAAPHMAQQRFDGDNIGNTLTNLAERDLIWSACAALLKENPKALAFGFSPSRVSWLLRDRGFEHGLVHNSPFDILMKYGIPGLLVFLLFLARLAWQCVRVLLAPSLRLYERMLTVFLLALVIHSMVEDLYPDVRHIAPLMFFAIAGFVEQTARGLPKRKSPRIKEG